MVVGAWGWLICRVFSPAGGRLPHAHALQAHAAAHGVGGANALGGFGKGICRKAVNGVGHGLAGGVLLVEGDDALPINAPKILKVSILRVHAEGVVKLLQKVAHHLFDGFEVHHHVIFIQRVGGKHQLYTAGVAVGELAAAGVLGEQVPALQLYGFTDAKHGRKSAHGGYAFFEDDVAVFSGFTRYHNGVGFFGALVESVALLTLNLAIIAQGFAVFGLYGGVRGVAGYGLHHHHGGGVGIQLKQGYNAGQQGVYPQTICTHYIAVEGVTGKMGV